MLLAMIATVVARFLRTSSALLGVLLVVAPALAQPDLPPPPAFDPPAEAAPVARAACPVLLGPRDGWFGPNSYGTLAWAVQPGLCWLELSVSFGLGAGEINASGGSIDPHDPVYLNSEASYVSFTVPLGARFWSSETHSVLGDAGFGFTRYLMSGDVATDYGDTWDGRLGTWDRPTTALVAYLGAGYGYRFEGAQAGPRFAAVIGALVHLTEFADSTMLRSPHPREMEPLQDALDAESDELREPEPYVEISMTWTY